MKVLVLNAMVPFVRGGAEMLADELVARLRCRRHDAELMRIPFAWDPLERVTDEMLACQMLQIDNADRVVALKFPAYLVPHPDKTLWLLHQFRQVYDLWPRPEQRSADHAAQHPIRAAVQSADNACVDASRRVFVNSPTTQNRLATFNNRSSEVLRPPLNDPERFYNAGYGDYIFCGGRINAMKRQHLLVEAMRHVASDLKLLIAGPPDRPADGLRLKSLVERHRLGDRVRLELGMLNRDRLAQHVNNALACAYLPIDEDSFGYVTMEACQASKAVLTTHDSGGVLGLVGHEETGICVDPEPAQLAEALDRLWARRDDARCWGEAACQRWQELGIDWDHTIDQLLN